MDAVALTKALVGGAERYEQYVAHSIDDITVGVGLPPTIIRGWNYVTARRNNSPAKLWNCLTGKGVFTNNINKSGIIEIAIMQDTLSSTALEILEATGIAWPMFYIDRSTNGFSVVASPKVRRIGTPEKRKSRNVNFEIFTFAASPLFISGGPRELA